MKRSFRLHWSVLLLLALSIPWTAVRAQPPGPGGPGGFGRPQPGGGMFGGPPSDSLVGQYDRLLSSPTVQKELNLTEEQKTDIQKARDKGRDAVRELYSGLRDLSEAERQVKMEEIAKKAQALTEETAKAVEALMSPSQLQRLRGLAIQAAGVSALADPQVQQDLRLDEYQAAVIRVIVARTSKKVRELFTSGSDPKGLSTKIEEIRTQAEKQVMDLLSEDQVTSLEKLKGSKLEIPSSELRGSTGRRGFSGLGKKRD